MMKKKLFTQKRVALVSLVVAVFVLFFGDQQFQEKGKKMMPSNPITVSEPVDTEEEVLDKVALPDLLVTSNGPIKVVDGPPMHGPEGEGPGYYEVQSGDTLWDIAEYVYGDGALWTEIWEANSALLTGDDPRNIGEPGNWIHAGQQILIPEL